MEEGDQEGGHPRRDWLFYLNRNLAAAIQRLAV
jgi:hypothetical protein